MAPLMRSECRKFAPNIFNKTKCTNCFRQKEEHSAEALESNRRWQRRWFVLYDDGELTYSVDEHPDTVPQAVISLLSTAGQGGSIVWEAPESETGHPHSLAVAAPERIHFVRGDSRDETRAWLASLLAVASPIASQGTSRIRQARHKRNATFPGGRSNPMSIGVAQRVISGTTAVSRQHSPVLRQRFNSCISPLHHALPLEVGERDRVDGHGFHSSPVCKASSSTSVSPTTSSEVLLTDKSRDDTTLSGSHFMVKLQVTEEVPVSRSYFPGVDSPSAYCKDVEATDVFLNPTQFLCTPNERLSSVKNEVEQDIKVAPIAKSIRSEIVSLGIEASKSSPTNSWKKYSFVSDERQTVLGLHSLEKNVRGDPDGCVLDSISTSSCCSVEGIEHIDGVATEQTVLPLQAKDEIPNDIQAADSSQEGLVRRDLTRQPSDRQESAKHGWLMKLGSSKEWSKHWFVLHGSGLLYYRDPSAEGIGILDGVIDLGLVQDIRDVAVERNHGLQLTTWDGKQCILSAVTPGIRSGWIAALRKAAGLSSLTQKQSSPDLHDQSSASLEASVSSGNGLVPLQCISEASPQVDPLLQSSRASASILSMPIHMVLSTNSKLGATETVQSTLSSPLGNSNLTEVTPQVIHKGKVKELTDNKLDRSNIIFSSLCNTNVGQTNAAIASETQQGIDCLSKENTPCNGSNFSLSGTCEFPLESRGLQDKNSTNILSGRNSASSVSVEPIQNPNDPSCVSVAYQGSGARSTTHKPPVSPAVISSCSRTSGRRYSSSNCVRLAGSQSSDRGASGSLMLESNTSDCTRPERPSYLSLKSLSSSDSRESKFATTIGCAPMSYISSSASSCSLSDEDFRTASEASLHSTPISEMMVDSNSNSVLWSKGEIVNARGETSSSSHFSLDGGDLGAVLPPSPPLNRTPISRVKERARSRVIKRSKTPPEEDLQSIKIETLAKKVKELVAALAAKEAELLKEKTKESSYTAAFKKRSVNELFEPKSKIPSLVTGDRGMESISTVSQNPEEDINAVTVCSQVLTDTIRMNEFEDNNLMVTSVRRLSCSSVTTPHTLPRMGSLSDLTNVDLDLDLNAVDRERLIEEWCGLRARFEKAVREIHALRKELRACQGHVDALELERSATSMCLAEERKRAEADMSLMANRVQDLTVKLSAAEKQVRQLKQKASRVETREKRRSLSLRGDRDVRSGTDPSLGTGKLPKEISDRLTHLEACLGAAIGHSIDKLALSSSAELELPRNRINNQTSNDDKIPPNGNTTILLPSSETIHNKGNNDGLTSLFTSPMKSSKGNLQGQTKPEDALLIRNVHLNSSGGALRSDSNSTSRDDKGCFKEYEGGENREKSEESIVGAQKNPETCPTVTASCSGNNQRRMRVEGRRQRINSRLIRRTVEDSSHGDSGNVAEEEEPKAEDESAKGCDPLRILVRLGSLEGRVSDFLKTNKNGKKLANPTVVEFPASENKKNQEMERMADYLCPRCEDMRLAMERMKKELLLINHGISCRNEEQNSTQIHDGGSVMVDRYREEIEQLRVLCEKGMRAMDLSHQRLIKEMEEKHREEVVRVQFEKEQALREETKATLAALDAMRKAHETEVQREVAKFKEEFSRRMSAKHELSTNHQAEMEGIRREILSLSQRYSSKCVECASLREQLRLAKGIKDNDHVADSEASVEMPSEHS